MSLLNEFKLLNEDDKSGDMFLSEGSIEYRHRIENFIVEYGESLSDKIWNIEDSNQRKVVRNKVSKSTSKLKSDSVTNLNKITSVYISLVNAELTLLGININKLGDDL